MNTFRIRFRSLEISSGEPELIRKSQQRRGASLDVVEKVIEGFEDHRKTSYAASRIGAKINDTQKQIGQKKKAKENADDLIKLKEDLQKEKAAGEEEAAKKLKALHVLAKTVGNYVHDSVPVSNDEVGGAGAVA